MFHRELNGFCTCLTGRRDAGSVIVLLCPFKKLRNCHKFKKRELIKEKLLQEESETGFGFVFA